MMKKVGFLLAMICILSLTGCGMCGNATQSEPAEQYCEYLTKNTENMFTDEDGIESAEAIVSYDEGTERYSIELSLKTNGKVDSEKIEEYKTYLSKTYADVILIIDGEVM